MKLKAETLFRLAGLGALAVSGALIAALALFCWFVAPRGVGIDSTESAVAQIAVGLIFIALIAVHLVFGRVLLSEAKAASTD
jgi:hypothetical protein